MKEHPLKSMKIATKIIQVPTKMSLVHVMYRKTLKTWYFHLYFDANDT